MWYDVVVGGDDDFATVTRAKQKRGCTQNVLFLRGGLMLMNDELVYLDFLV